MREVIENILYVDPYKVELAICDYQDEGIKLEVFLLDECFQVIEILTALEAEGNNTDNLVSFMVKLCEEVESNGISCECLDEIQIC